MADTRTQMEVEKWVRDEWMPSRFNRRFQSQKLRLTSGGQFDFDAVSEDKAIVALISTSKSATSSGKPGVGKMMKIRSDMLFLMMSEAEKRYIIFTEKSMYKRCSQEKANGRVPNEIEFLLAEIPGELKEKLQHARSIASKEVRPVK